jgi:hypothetical protein
MASPLSARAERYLATRERVSAEHDAPRIRAALERGGAPPLEIWVDFQRRYGGLVEYDRLNRFEWGVLHAKPHPHSPFLANEVDTSEDGGVRLISCCNCHMSDHWLLDASGSLFWCFPPAVAASFDKQIERSALWWELAATAGRVRSVDLLAPDDHEAKARLISKLAESLVTEASDACETVYRKDGVVAAVRGGRLSLYAVEGLSREVLHGVPHVVRRSRVCARIAPP